LFPLRLLLVILLLGLLYCTTATIYNFYSYCT
jgi:hypothetical protein